MPGSGVFLQEALLPQRLRLAFGTGDLNLRRRAAPAASKAAGAKFAVGIAGLALTVLADVSEVWPGGKDSNSQSALFVTGNGA